jgi:C4-dicarboxylate-specific signal transduction histidine kinase
VLVRGFAEVYRVKPDFPIDFLGRWLKQYSFNQTRETQLEEAREEKVKRVEEMERNLKELVQKAEEVPLIICSKNSRKRSIRNRKRIDSCIK